MPIIFDAFARRLIQLVPVLQECPKIVEIVGSYTRPGGSVSQAGGIEVPQLLFVGLKLPCQKLEIDHRQAALPPSAPNAVPEGP